MAKDTSTAAALTPELDGIPAAPKKRGRPPTGHAKTAAERKRNSRLKQFSATLYKPEQASITALLEAFSYIWSEINEENKAKKKNTLVRLATTLQTKAMEL